MKRIPTEKVALATVEAEGLVQLAGYLDQLGASEGWLVIFDQRPGRTWDERMWRREAEIDGKVIHLLGG